MSKKIMLGQLDLWIEKFDSTDSNSLLEDIINGKINTEVMSDSVYAYWHGELELAQQFYDEMWVEEEKNNEKTN